MTPEEALKIVDKNIASERPFWQTVRAALAKQVAEKPKDAVSPGWCFDWACCNCGRHNRTQFMPAYCNECGQKILLEDEE